MQPFHRLTQPTVFISASRDMRLEASIAVEIIDEIAHSFPLHRNLISYLWSSEDKPWFGDTTWQEQIPRPSDPMVVAVICLFGERLGSPLPPYFPLPDDLALPGVVQFPWRDDADNKIPLTGTLFEYLDARNEKVGTAGGRKGAKMLVYLRGDASKAASHLPPDQRDWGYWRHYEEVSQSRRRSDINEYFRQIGYLTKFFDEVHRPSERGCIFLGPEPEGFRKALVRDLAEVLGLPAAKKPISALKGLEAYDVGDSEIFVGRDRSIDKMFREIERKDASGEGGTGALIVGASGAGKSSVLRAGLVGEAVRGARNSLERTLRALVVTPQQLGDAHPLAVLGGLLAGQDVLPELGRADDLERALRAESERAPELLIGRIEEACLAAAEGEKTKIRFGLRPKMRLILALDQLDQMVEPDANAEHQAPLLRFLIEGVRRRAFWFVGSLSDARLSRWNRLIGEYSSLLDYWPLGNPDWEALSEIVATSFELLQLPIDPSLKDILISSCRSIDREGTATLPLLSVAMTRLAEALRRECAVAARAAMSERLGAGDGVVDGRLLHVVLPEESIAKLKEVADVRSAIDELAEQARREAVQVSARQGDVRAAQISLLLRHLVAVRPGASIESISLVPCHLEDPAVIRGRSLVEALRKRRIITDIREDHIQIVHEAVVRHWQRAATWFDQTQKALGFIETIKPLAYIWTAAADRLKRAMLLPVGYCVEVQSILVDWHGDDKQLPMDFIRASLKEHASSIIDLGTESGWYALGVAAFLGETELVETYLAAGADLALGGPDGATPLHLASSLAIAKALLQRGANANARNASGASGLHAAAASGLADVVEELLKADCDPRALDGSDNTALHSATNSRHCAVAELLVRAGLDVNQYNGSGETPFTLACRLGDEGLMALFLAFGADVELCRQSSSSGEPPKPPLVLAVESGEPACVQLLIGSGVSSEAGAAAMLIAAPRGADVIVRQLVQSGAPVNCHDISTGLTPLHLAARHGHGDVMGTLLSAGADTQAISNDGGTVLHAATLSGTPDAVERALASGAALDQITADGETALHLASKNKGDQIIQLLLESGARADIEDNYGYTALGRAVDYRDPTCAAALLEAGAAALKSNAAGLNPLHIAARHGNVKLMDLLSGAAGDLAIGLPLAVFAAHSGSAEAVGQAVKLGAAIDAPDSRGMTALMYAAWNAMDEMAALLLAKGADPRRRGPEGWSALMFAAAVNPTMEEAAKRIVERLVSAGASLTARDHHGRDALAIARLFGLKSVTKMLERQGEVLPHADARP